LLELVNAVTTTEISQTQAARPPRTTEKRWSDMSVSEAIGVLEEPLSDLYESLRAFVIALGDDVQEKQLKLYVAFKRIKNFVCVEIHKDKLVLYLKLSPDTVNIEPGVSRDVRNIGHWGTGDLEVLIKNREDLEKAKPLLLRSYDES